eukprot:TRINITY_DN15326_c0_g1_i3.p1 TRINITY_DN15326_c0_g1~~TRINITY_DN15326_c0_g1_i3.p1  ORF type:complete len:469 (+),score=37.74 TRINITY_DN15326_c0_g1_i3:75-1409(+)
MASPSAFAVCLLVLTVGVQSNVEPPCVDLLDNCGELVAQGVCQQTNFFPMYCRESCHLCTAIPLPQFEQDKIVHGARMMAARPILELFDWQRDDVVEVYYGEFLLSAWIVGHSPWNAFHSGLAFRNNRTGRKMLLEFTPDDTSSVTKLVVPEVRLKSSLWRAAMLGEVDFGWRDGGHMAFHNSWPEWFTSTTLLGLHSGATLFNLISWVITDYIPRFSHFNPLELVRPQDPSAGGKTTLLRSRMCHDFVTDALWVLYNLGASLDPNVNVFRDHIIMYGEIMESIADISSSADARKRELRYLRGLDMFMEDMRQEFTHARTALLSLWRLRVPVFLRDEQDVYHRVKLLPPFLNYCYLPLAIPPKVHNLFDDDKLCALGMRANLTNFTTPWPQGALLAAEERVDHPKPFAAVLLAAICVAFATRPSTRSASVIKGALDSQMGTTAH